MKLFLQLLCFLLCNSLLFAQEGFQFTSAKKKVSIPFKLINNLIIVPIKVNGVELNFLVDTGVEETIIFSLDEKHELELFEIQKVKLKGLGNEVATEGLKSSKNSITMPGLKSFNHEILIVLDEEINFSSSLGIPVNGIIGSRFFIKNLVEINYSKKKIIFYNPSKINKEQLVANYIPFKISIEKSKPYLQTSIMIDSVLFDAKCLIDTGNSDPVWLFENQSPNIKVPLKNFNDFLGRGFSGNINGKRARIAQLSIDIFQFEMPIASFLDAVSLQSVAMVKDRVGSIGGELLQRFNVIFDYQNNKIYLKKNQRFSQPFKYNISGISIQHMGLQWISENKPLRTELNISTSDKDDYSVNPSEIKYRFALKPLYEISNVRENSLAAKAGLVVGDILLSINDKSAYNYSLQELNGFLKADAGQYISIRVKRNGKELFFRFQLEELL